MLKTLVAIILLLNTFKYFPEFSHKSKPCFHRWRCMCRCHYPSNSFSTLIKLKHFSRLTFNGAYEIQSKIMSEVSIEKLPGQSLAGSPTLLIVQKLPILFNETEAILDIYWHILYNQFKTIDDKFLFHKTWNN